MLNGRRILAVVPARGGSKGISLKNLREVEGVPLVGLVGRVLEDVPEVDRSVVSTDHEGIARVAMDYGLEAPFRRPPALSGDLIGDIDVLTHALNAVEAQGGNRYDIVVMLQPTSPLRRPEDVSATIGTLVDEDLDSVWTVSETDAKGHPLKQLTLTEGRLGYYDPEGASIIARQQLAPVYHRNGVAYALTRQCLLEYGTLMGPRAGAVPLQGIHVSIDTEWDIRLVEFVLQQERSKT